MQEEIFTISLNEEGAGYLQRFAAKARTVFYFSILLTIVNLVTMISRFTSFGDALRFTSGRMKVQIVAALLYVIFSVVIIPLQAYYLFAFSGRIRQSLRNGDTFHFNASFKLLNVVTVVWIVNLAVNVAYFLYAYISNRR